MSKETYYERIVTLTRQLDQAISYELYPNIAQTERLNQVFDCYDRILKRVHAKMLDAIFPTNLAGQGSIPNRIMANKIVQAEAHQNDVRLPCVYRPFMENSLMNFAVKRYYNYEMKQAFTSICEASREGKLTVFAIQQWNLTLGRAKTIPEQFWCKRCQNMVLYAIPSDRKYPYGFGGDPVEHMLMVPGVGPILAWKFSPDQFIKDLERVTISGETHPKHVIITRKNEKGKWHYYFKILFISKTRSDTKSGQWLVNEEFGPTYYGRMKLEYIKWRRRLHDKI